MESTVLSVPYWFYQGGSVSFGGLFGHNVTPIGLVSQEPSPTGSLKAFECSLIGFELWHNELSSAPSPLKQRGESWNRKTVAEKSLYIQHLVEIPKPLF